MISMHETLITAEKKSLDNDLSALIFSQNPIATLILDENANILHLNLAFIELSGYSESELLGEHLSFFTSNKNGHLTHDVCFRNSTQSNEKVSCEMYVPCKDGKHIFIRKNSQSIISQGNQYFIFTFEDITEQQRVLEHYRHLSIHDPLTGLPNRNYLQDNFKKAEDRAIRSEQKIALIICDINEFKHFNDNYGHDFGDSVLKTVAKTLEKLLRSADTVARYGGDEFVLILEDLAQCDQMVHIVNKIKSAFPATIMNGDEACQIKMSIGSACFPDDGINFNDLIQVADKSMYQEKKHFYDSQTRASNPKRDNTSAL